MEIIKSWEDRITINSEIASKYNGCDIVTPNATLTWLEVFVGIATIVKNEQNLLKVHQQFNHMLFGYSEVFMISDTVFYELISSLVESKTLERTDPLNIKLSYCGIDLLIHNWLIDRRVYSETRLHCDRLSKVMKNEQGGNSL